MLEVKVENLIKEFDLICEEVWVKIVELEVC